MTIPELTDSLSKLAREAAAPEDCPAKMLTAAILHSLCAFLCSGLDGADRLTEVGNVAHRLTVTLHKSLTAPTEPN